jgi:hypothetical protein
MARQEVYGMPDIWTKHPDIVRDLLKEAGFTCGVEPRFLKGRDPAWTCTFDGKTIRGDLYIHDVVNLRGEIRPEEGPPPPVMATVADRGGPALALALLGVVGARWLTQRRGRR